jgi:transcriptional regulator with XRE-family HTH domain
MDGQDKDTLRILIRKAGLTYSQLAKRLGTSSTHISDWNHGKKHPSFRTACRIARELEVSLDKLAESLGYLEEREDEESIE